MNIIQANVSAGNYKNCVHIFYFKPNEAAYNSALKEIYTRQYLTVNPYTGYYADQIIQILVKLRSLLFLPVKKLINLKPNHGFKPSLHFEVDKQDVVKQTRCHLNLLTHECELGKIFLSSFPENRGIVCLSLKEKIYYTKQRIFDNYPMAENEFGDIKDYIPAIKKLTENNFLVIRMGGSLDYKTVEIGNPLFFDYAVYDNRSDLLDIYIANKCIFHISNGTGYDQLGGAFRKPVYYTSVRAYTYLITQYPFTLFLPIQIYNKNEGKLLTFREIFELEKQIYKANKHYAHCIDHMNKLGYYFVKKTPKEIASYASEVLSHYSDNQSNENYRNNELANRFWNIYMESNFQPEDRRIHKSQIYINPSIGFLKNNEWMLE